MPTFSIPCSWEMSAIREIEADTFEDAVQIAIDGPLPDGSYVSDSFRVDSEQLSELNKKEGQ